MYIVVYKTIVFLKIIVALSILFHRYSYPELSTPKQECILQHSSHERMYVCIYICMYK